MCVQELHGSFSNPNILHEAHTRLEALVEAWHSNAVRRMAGVLRRLETIMHASSHPHVGDYPTRPSQSLSSLEPQLNHQVLAYRGWTSRH